MGSVCRGNSSGKMAKNCMKITKSTFWGQNSGGHGGGKSIFWVVRGSPQFPPLGKTLGIKGTLSLRVLLPHSLSYLVGYENKTGRREIDSIDPTSLSWLGNFLRNYLWVSISEFHLKLCHLSLTSRFQVLTNQVFYWVNSNDKLYKLKWVAIICTLENDKTFLKVNWNPVYQDCWNFVWSGKILKFDLNIWQG